VSAVEHLAERAAQDGDVDAALRWWQTLAVHSPDSVRITLRLMRALEATGDRAAALRAADAHATLLASEFGAEPSPEVVALATRIREHPEPAPVPDPPVATSQPKAGVSTRPRAARRRWGIAAAGVTAAAVAVLAFNLAPWRGPPDESVAVLPFLNLSGDDSRQYFSDGLTEEILNALARVPGLSVASRSSAFQYRSSGVDVREVGRHLRVGAIVEGSVRAMGTRLRVTAQLIETRRGYHLWSQQYDFDMEDVFEVQEAIARAIAGALGDELLANLPTKLVAMGTRNTQAYDLYLRGRHEWNRRTTDGMWNALHAFEQAVALDPRFANAYAGMSDAWQLLPDYGNVPAREGLARAKTAALRAIALDTTLAEAYASLGAILDDYDHDRAGAERAYRRAIELNRRYATARQWLAIHLADERRFAEASAEIERARRLEPTSRIINTAVGAIRYFERDHAAAIAEYRAVLDQSPDFALAWALMGRALLIQGRVDSAVASLRRSVDLSNGDPSYRAVYAAALAAQGSRSAADSVANSVLAAQPGYVPYCELASAYIYMDDFDSALRLFEQAIEERDPAVKHLAVEPLYDGIRHDERFRSLLARVGLGRFAGPQDDG
jgi:TolB-like protein/Flp pilus assembly protein TadD